MVQALVVQDLVARARAVAAPLADVAVVAPRMALLAISCFFVSLSFLSSSLVGHVLRSIADHRLLKAQIADILPAAVVARRVRRRLAALPGLVAGRPLPMVADGTTAEARRHPIAPVALSPGGVAPFALGAGLGLAFWPGLWFHPVYFYHTAPYHYHNTSNNMNETKPVVCGCDETVECGCDNNTDTTYMKDLIGNGSYAGLNQSQVTVTDVNGTSTILVNGTLPNGTTASGGEDDDDSDSAGAGMRSLLEAMGFWPVVATISIMVFVA